MKRGPLIFDLKNYTQDVEETTEHYLIEDDYLKNEGKCLFVVSCWCMYKYNIIIVYLEVM